MRATRKAAPSIHTNTVEDYFSVFKRGMRGTYQHCKEKHLHRYLAEFDFRYNNRSALGVEDEERARKASLAPRVSASPIEQLVSSDPKQEKSRTRRRSDLGAQLELFPGQSLGVRP